MTQASRAVRSDWNVVASALNDCHPEPGFYGARFAQNLARQTRKRKLRLKLVATVRDELKHKYEFHRYRYATESEVRTLSKGRVSPHFSGTSLRCPSCVTKFRVQARISSERAEVGSQWRISKSVIISIDPYSFTVMSIHVLDRLTFISFATYPISVTGQRVPEAATTTDWSDTEIQTIINKNER